MTLGIRMLLVTILVDKLKPEPIKKPFTRRANSELRLQGHLRTIQIYIHLVTGHFYRSDLLRH
jgi:hypothetical protein